MIYFHLQPARPRPQLCQLKHQEHPATAIVFVGSLLTLVFGVPWLDDRRIHEICKNLPANQHLNWPCHLSLSFVCVQLEKSGFKAAWMSN